MARLALVLLASGALADEVPFWPHYAGLRKVQLLDGQWQFGFHKNADSMDASFKPSKDLTPNETAVPSCFDVAMPGHLGRRGVGMYRRTFQQEGRARLQFMACSFYCRVFLDGEEVGDHRAGGYVPWFLDLPAPATPNATRELFVLADNRFDKKSAPLHTGGDFWAYGGIMRSVLLHSLPEGEPWVWRAYVRPRAELGVVDVNVTLTDAAYAGEARLRLAFDGSSEATEVRGTARAGVVELRGVQVPRPRQWSLEDPQLHVLAVSLGGATVLERFGLRHWTREGRRLALNGKVLKLHGWSHHTQWPETGASPTTEQLDGDLHLMREAGARFVRGGHYPQDQRWLDRLDESGLAMWEETLGPNVNVREFTDWAYFMKYQLQQVDEMVAQSFNHPSIVLWGFFNEGESQDPRACPAYKACADRLRALDPSRFVTWASNRQVADVCLKHADVVSFNSYPAWYDHKNHPEQATRHWDEMAAFVRMTHPKKPFVISETGAGGVYEWSNNKTAAYWTVNYQVEVLKRDVKVALSNEDIAGVALWHFMDFKIDDAATVKCGPCVLEKGVEPPTCSYVNVNCFRPGGLNHKGVVDFYRRKKASFDIVAAMYNASESYGRPADLVV